MKKLISETNEIIIYEGANGLYFDPNNKSLSYLSNITPCSLEGLEAELEKRKSQQLILGASSDCYPLMEADLNATREVLRLIDKYKHGVTIYTRSKLVLKDLDILKSIRSHSRVVIMLEMFSANEADSMNISGVSVLDKIKVLDELKNYDIEVGLDVKPVLPFISDDINNFESLINIAQKYNCSYFLYRGSAIIINNKNKEAVYHLLDDYYFGLRAKYDAIRNESYVITSPKSAMLDNYLNDMLSGTNIMFDTDQIIKKVHSYARKHKQLSLF